MSCLEPQLIQQLVHRQQGQLQLGQLPWWPSMMPSLRQRIAQQQHWQLGQGLIVFQS